MATPVAAIPRQFRLRRRSVRGSPSTRPTRPPALARNYVTTQSGNGLPVLKVTQDQINSQDGTSYTLLLSENTLQGSSWSMWASQGAANPRFTTPATLVGQLATPPCYPLFLTTFMWANNTAAGSSTPPTDTTGSGKTATTTTFQRINGDKNNTTANDIIHARPASNHPGICVFTFCDGHIRTLSEDIDYRVYKQLMTPNGGNTGIITAAAADQRLGRRRQRQHDPQRSELLSRMADNPDSASECPIGIDSIARRGGSPRRRAFFIRSAHLGG